MKKHPKKWKNNFKSILFVGALASCQNDMSIKLQIEENNNLQQETINSVKNEKGAISNVLVSTDSLFQINIYKTISKLSNGYYNMSLDSMQYTCMELTRIDKGILGFPKYRTLSDAMPEHYLTITVQDSIYIAQSEWFLCEHSILKYKFHFAFDAFEMFGDSVEITLGYPGWNFPHERVMVEFKTNNFSELISNLVPPNSDTKKIDNNWFLSKGIEGIGLGTKKNVHKNVYKKQAKQQ